MSTLRKYKAGQAAPETEWEKNSDKNFDSLAQDLYLLLNKGIILPDNVNCYIGTATTDPTPGVETAVSHGLKRTPSGYIILTKDKAAHIYNSTAPDGSSVYLASDVASVAVKVLVL